MAWPELSVDDFPPRRDDEPSSLRQEIIDELSDHFACALNRELHKNPDEQLARKRVLEQFGDPIKVARQLWLDAMKEKIMSQRIMTGVSVVMAVCGFIVVGLVWSMMKESQAFNTRMMAQLAEIASRPQPVIPAERDQKILEQLKALKEEQQAAANASSEGMNQISFQLVQDSKDRKPAVGFTGTLTKSGDRLEAFTLKASSNAEGILDFGKLPWGSYYLNLNSPWGEYYSQSVSVIPGRNLEQKIICPAAAPAEIPVQFQVDWPAEINAADLMLICDFRSVSGGDQQMESSRLIEGETWRYFKENRNADFRDVYLINSQNRIAACPLERDGTYEDIDLKQLVETTSIRMSQGKHVLPDLILVQKKDLQRLRELNDLLNLHVLNRNRGSVGTYSLERRAMLGSFPGFSSTEEGSILLVPFLKASPNLTQAGPSQLGEPARYADGLELSRRLEFTVNQGEENLWKIKLPYLENLKIPKRISGVGQGFF